MIQLIAIRGRLHIPNSAITDKLAADFYRTAPCRDPIVVCNYAAGDCDTVPWPMEDPEYSMETLSKALYDSREVGLIPNDQSVLLPDGTEFEIESHLSII
jgi:hypothetical protein